MSETRSPQLSDVIRDALEHRLSGVHVCMPAKVESYDPTTQTCTVRPQIKQTIFVGQGETETLEYPAIYSVPYAHPRAGNWFVHFPLTVGDIVTLVFAERALDLWRATASVRQPDHTRMHDLSDAIAMPCNLYPDAQALVGLNAGAASFGHALGKAVHVSQTTVSLGSAAPVDSAATALKVATELNALKALISGIGPDHEYRNQRQRRSRLDDQRIARARFGS